MSTARLDKEDYPHYSELGLRFSVSVHTHTQAQAHKHLLWFIAYVSVFAYTSCVTAFQATGIRDNLDFSSEIFCREAEKYH